MAGLEVDGIVRACEVRLLRSEAEKDSASCARGKAVAGLPCSPRDCTWMALRWHGGVRRRSAAFKLES